MYRTKNSAAEHLYAIADALKTASDNARQLAEEIEQPVRLDVEKVVSEINRRTRISFHPDI